MCGKGKEDDGHAFFVQLDEIDADSDTAILLHNRHYVCNPMWIENNSDELGFALI
jgi:hypothetical protein